MLCGKDEAVSQIKIGRTKGYQIGYVKMTCVNVRTLVVSNENVFDGAGIYGTPPTHSCKTGELGAGLVIRYGKYVNGLALICGDYRPVAAPAPDPNIQLCRDYAARMMVRLTEYARLKCSNYTGEKTAAGQERLCLSYGAKASEIIQYNERGLDDSLEICRKALPGGATTKTVAAEVTVYDKPQGSDVCYLVRDDTVTILTGADIPAAFRNLSDKNWVPVRGNTGGCNGKIGGVYNDGKLN